MKVFKNKFGRWETACRNRMLNGEVIKYYMPVDFQKGQEPMVDSIDIEPVKWWLSCFLSRVEREDGTSDQVVKPKLFISDWKELEVKGTIDRSIDVFKAENYAEYSKKEDTEQSPGLDIEAEDLPFY